MNTDLVFTGFDERGEERLIYKEIDNYIDLINNEKITNIDLETLRFLKETVNVLKHMPKVLVEKAYNKDRKKVVNTRDILVGKRTIITDLKRYSTDPFVCHYEWNCNFYENGLYQSEGTTEIEYQEYKVYKNLFDGKKYIVYSKSLPKILDNADNFECVYLEPTTLKDLIKESVLTKKKVYELANCARKESQR